MRYHFRPSGPSAQRSASCLGHVGALAVLLGASVESGLQAQPVFTSDATLTSNLSLNEDASITNSAVLEIQTGGHLSVGANEVFVGGTEFAAGIGTMHLSGGGDASNRAGHIGYMSSSTGTVTVSGAGSTWTNTGSLFVGRNGSGSLTVSNGGTVSNVGGAIGFAAGSNGQVTLSGNGSAWSSSSAVFVGRAGTGTLTVEGGATGTSSTIDLGFQSTGHGTFTLRGTGTTWTSQYTVLGAGTLTVKEGATFNTNTHPSSIAARGDGAAIANVSGAGSTWTTHNLYVGSYGEGHLNIEDGGEVTSALGVVGFFSGATGTVLVEGSGSKWTNSAQLYISYEAAGTVTVRDGGRLAFTSNDSAVILADQTVGVGTLNIGGAQSDEAAAAGIVGATTVRAGAGTGVLQFNTTGTAAAPTYFTRDGTSTGAGVNTADGLSLVHTAGHTVFSGTLAHTGATQITGGVFIVTGTISASAIQVGEDAALDGTGTISGPVSVASGGRVGSDYSTGTLTFEEGVSFADGASLNLDLGTVGDLIRVSGGTLSAPPGATIFLNLGDAGGFTGGTYTFLDATGAALDSIGASSFEIGTFVGGYTYTVLQTGNLFQIVASPIPEPSALAVIVGAAAFVATGTRRRRFGSERPGKIPAARR